MAKKGLSIVILFVLLAATAILASCDRTSLERYGDRIADRLNEMMGKVIFANSTYRTP